MMWWVDYLLLKQLKWGLKLKEIYLRSQDFTKASFTKIRSDFMTDLNPLIQGLILSIYIRNMISLKID